MMGQEPAGAQQGSRPEAVKAVVIVAFSLEKTYLQPYSASGCQDAGPRPWGLAGVGHWLAAGRAGLDPCRVATPLGGRWGEQCGNWLH